MIAWGMQVTRSSFKGDRPVCPRGEGHRVHRHGAYPHYADCESGEKERVPRFLCVVCRLTISVVPDTRLPYRSLNLETLWRWFDWQFCGGPDPPAAGERERGCLVRAVKCFGQHSPVLRTALGQIVTKLGADAGSLWRTLSRLSKSESILHFLQTKLKPKVESGRRGFSLLGAYLCLAVQPFSSV